jgi:AraC-like DNA-binding protein
MDGQLRPAGWSDRTIDDVDGWREGVSLAFAPVEIARYRAGFSGTIRMFERDGLRVSLTSYSAHVVQRSSSLIPRDATSQFALCFQGSGHGTVVQDGKIAHLGPGDACIYDTSRPYTLAFDEPSHASLAVVVPGRQLPGMTPRTVQRLTALRLPSSDPVTSTARGALASLENGLASLPSLPQHAAVRGILDIVEMLCLHAAAVSGTFRGELREAELARVLAYVDEHLPDPDLDPHMVASAHCMSVRSLHALAHAGGINIAAWIRRRRLERCRADLADPALGALSVATIGARWGLVNPQYFSTLFRTEYGVTPSAYRKTAS